MSIPPHLSQAVRESRAAINREYAGLLEELDVPKRVRNSVQQHPLRWVGGAAATGLLTALFGVKNRFNSSGKTVESKESAAKSSFSTFSKAGFWAALLEIGKLLYPVLRPLVMQMVSNVVHTGLAKKSRLQ